MSTAREVLDRLAEIGAIVRPAGDDRLILRAAKPGSRGAGAAVVPNKGRSSRHARVNRARTGKTE